MKFAGIIEARMRSSRLPGKVLKPILGKPLMERLVERLRRARTLDDVVLATTDQPYDDPLADLAEKAGLPFFRGSEDDVLLRVLQAAESSKADVIVEITGDCPLIDPGLVDKVVGDFRMGGADFVSNVLGFTTPRGTDVRVFLTEDLAEINRVSRDPVDHEHVSIHFWEHPEKYTIRNVTTAVVLEAAHWRLTVDTEADYALICRIYEALYPSNPEFTLADVLELLASRPDLLALNAAVEQKATR